METGMTIQPPIPDGLRDGPVYLDYNATTPVDPRVVEAMLPYLTDAFGNPSSGHRFGGRPAAAVATARRQVGALIGVDPGGVVFLGSGSEADAFAIRGTVTAARQAGHGRPHVITQATEHPAVLEACQYVEQHHAARVTVLGVSSDGRVDPQALDDAIDQDTVLVSVMHANNETGVVQPIRELADIAHRHGALLHTDAAQTVGKIPVDVTALGADLLTLVGHKMYGPKGVAALAVRDGVVIDPLIAGGGQESGRRAGTENVAGIVALGTAAELAAGDVAAGSVPHLQQLRDGLHDELQECLPGRVQLNGHLHARLPQTLNVSIDGLAGHELLERCAVFVAASTGSACHAGQHEPSPVLTAMGHPASRALAAVRLSLGRFSSHDEVQRAADALAAAAG